MELYKELLAHILSKTKVHVRFSDFNIDANELVEQTCYKLLCRIRDIIRAVWSHAPFWKYQQNYSEDRKRVGSFS